MEAGDWLRPSQKETAWIRRLLYYYLNTQWSVNAYWYDIKNRCWQFLLKFFLTLTVG